MALCQRTPDADILIDDHALMASLRPWLEGRMRYNNAAFDPVLEDEIATLSDPRTPLPHGGVMHIALTPAATLIDIDAAAASHIAPLTLNIAFIPEICRQIRLRNLSGGILVDFAGLKPAARAKLTAPLRAALASDPLRPVCLGISHLGFAEITRRRIRPPLAETLRI
ncbi:MAG: ribonuclease E/G [Acidocella sp.]|nr:ribonuclease E/G [Acidocella sp.]